MSGPTKSNEPASQPQRHRRPEQAHRPAEKAAGRPLTGQTGHATPSSVLDLQGRVGNQAVLRMLANRQVQAKLTVGPANDPYEREADRMADQVLRTPAAAPTAQRQELPGATIGQDKDEDLPAAAAAEPPMAAGPQEEQR